jgi:hypothetical protein
MTVLWDVAPCRLVEVYRRFRDACCFHLQSLFALMMEAASTSETSVNSYQTTRRNIPEDIHLHIAFVRIWSLAKSLTSSVISDLSGWLTCKFSSSSTAKSFLFFLVQFLEFLQSTLRSHWNVILDMVLVQIHPLERLGGIPSSLTIDGELEVRLVCDGPVGTNVPGMRPGCQKWFHVEM